MKRTLILTVFALLTLIRAVVGADIHSLAPERNLSNEGRSDGDLCESVTMSKINGRRNAIRTAKDGVGINSSSIGIWERQNPTQKVNTLNGVWGSSANDVFAVGENGTILHYVVRSGVKWIHSRATH